MSDDDSEVQHYLESVIALSPGHVFWRDRNSVFLGCNEGLAKTFGLRSRHDIVGKTVYDFAKNIEEAEHMVETDRYVMESAQDYSSEVKYTFPDDRQAIYLSKKSPLRDSKGNIVGVICISFDITAQKQVTILEKAKAVTEEKVKVMELLASSIAHEIRTPLASIKVGSDGIKKFIPRIIDNYRLAKKGKTPKHWVTERHVDKISQVFANIEKETEHANTMINILLANVKHSDATNNQWQICSVKRCIRDTLTRYPFQRHERNLLIWKPEENTEFLFEGIEILIIHLLFNLIKNALHHVYAANKGNITIWTKVTDQRNSLHFKDTGTGIPSDVQEQIFEQFFSQTNYGTGLGLTFCKMVMNNLGGDITCHSVENEYTEFVLRFPKT